jgi:hypothetical protein
MKSREDLMDRTLRWMCENLDGAYNAKYPTGHSKAGRYCVNSGTCILVCCYIDALGKVLLRGKGSPRKRFNAFLSSCMPDFLDESSSITALRQASGGTNDGATWLYKVFRCGFVHSFYPRAGAGWSRRVNLRKYWFQSHGLTVLNIDELVRGFHRGLAEFRCLAQRDPTLRSRFKEYITAK